MATKKAKLPRTIYVYEDDDGGEKYLNAHYSIEDTADLGERRLVGIYDLREVGEVESIPTYTRK